MKRRCYAKDCIRFIARRRLMCGDHWRLVPRELKSDIRRAARQWTRENTHDNAETFWDAVSAAIEVVAQLSQSTEQRNAD